MSTVQSFELPERVFNDFLIGLHLKCMRSFGYIIARGQPNKYFHLLKGSIFIASFAVFSCLIFIKISRGFASLALASTSCATGFTFLSTSIATTNALFQRKRVVRMVIFLHEDITEVFHMSDREEEILLASTVRYLRIITGAMWIPTLLAAVIVIGDCFYRIYLKPETVFNIREVLNGTAEPILLLQLFPFGEVCDNFIVAYLVPFYAMILGISTIPCWHTFVTCLMKYIVLKYAITNKRLREYDFAKLPLELNYEKLKSSGEKDSQYWHTKMCEFYAGEQTKLKWFTKELESLIRIPVFSDFVIFSALMCFLFYAIAVGSPSNMDYMFLGMYIFVMAFLLWLYHWHATLVTESSDGFRLALYSTPWYTFPVVRGAYSYFSFLRNAGMEQQ